MVAEDRNPEGDVTGRKMDVLAAADHGGRGSE
jgi:hypothetical protein